MNTNIRRPIGIRVGILVGLLTGVPRVASGSGFATAKFGGEHGSVVSTNPTALYYNPGGMGFSEGVDLFVDGTLALRSASWNHVVAPTDPTDPPGGEGANAGHASLFNVFGAPSLSATMRLGDFTLGAGVFVPFGGRATWGTHDQFAGSDYPLANAGVQRWHAIDGSLTFLYGTVGVAYRYGPIAFGVGANLIFSAVSYTQAKNPTGAGDPDTAREGRAKLDASGLQGSFGAGIMAEALEKRLWFGLSYQAQPGLGPHTLAGTLDVKSPTVAQHDDITFTEALPDIWRFGLRWQPFDQLELRLFGDYTRWSVNRTQCVALKNYPCAVYPDGSDATGGTLTNKRRYWNDTYGVHLGVSHWLTPDVELFAGVGFETAATPDATLEPGLADADNILRAVGARFRVMSGTRVAISYTDLQFVNRDNTGKSELAKAEMPTRQPDGGGQYTQWVASFNLNLEKTFP